jgi:hypothetical protein
MPKAVRTAEQIRDELQSRMAKIAADVPGALRVRIKRFCRDKAILMSRPEMTRTAHITIE